MPHISVTTHVAVRIPILRCAAMISVFSIIHILGFLPSPLSSLYIGKLAKTITIIWIKQVVLDY